MLVHDYNAIDYTFFGVVAENFLGNKKLRLRDGSVHVDTFSKHSFWRFLQEGIGRTEFFNETKKCYIIINDAGTLFSLENIQYDQPMIDLLNTHGLSIYNYETLLLDIPPKKQFSTIHAYDYKDQFPKGFENTEINLNNLYCLEFESIEKFIQKNKLTNVTYCTNEQGVKDLLKHKYSFDILEGKDILLLHQLNDSVDAFGFKNEYKQYFDSKLIRHKFWNGNWRYAQHRQIIASDLVQRNSLISWAFTDLPDLNFNKFISKGTQLLNNNAPYCMDINFPATSLQIDNEPDMGGKDINNFDPYIYPLPIEYYSKCFCSVINEGEFSRPTASISEKTINTIKAGRPFIMVAPPNSLVCLKNLGFKTFSDYWDESYDTEFDNTERMKKILEVINEIDKFTITELQSLYNDMKNIIFHNFEHLYYLRDNYKI